MKTHECVREKYEAGSKPTFLFALPQTLDSWRKKIDVLINKNILQMLVFNKYHLIYD